jgi:ubiquinol-cytochrome c reductase cytochrome c1 subunit
MEMRSLPAVLLLSCLSLGVPAAEPGVPLMDAKVDLDDKASLQRGARLFVNYCLSCHSAAFMRYNRLGADLGISEEQVAENLLFAADKPGDTMTVAMRPSSAEKWFGNPPPDLSVIARARGADWIYTFLLSFYRDEDPQRPFGVNNLVLQGTSMPAVLSSLQGVQVLAAREGAGGHETTEGHGERSMQLELAEPGALNPAQYRRAVRDLVNYIAYMSEPAQLVRYDIGVWVLLFLAGFFVLTRALYKEYWKDVH